MTDSAPDFKPEDRFKHLPDELKNGRHWTAATKAKVPIDPKTGRAARTNDPTTWGTLAEALACNAPHVSIQLLGGPWIVLDIDHMTDGPVHHELSSLLKALPHNYSEISCSSTGMHIWYRGQLPAELAGKKVLNLFGSSCNLEMYDGTAGRHMITTGKCFIWATGMNEIGDWHHGAAVILKEFVDKARKYHEPRPSKRHGLTAATVDHEGDLTRAHFGLIQKRLLDADDRTTWVAVGGALHGLGALGLALWREWSATSSKYVEGECDKKWHGLGKGTSFGALVKMFQRVDASWSDDLPTKNGRPQVPGGIQWTGNVEDEERTFDQPPTPPQVDQTLGRQPGGLLVLSERETIPTADTFLAECHDHAGGRTLASYAGELWQWADNHWSAIEEEQLAVEVANFMLPAKRWRERVGLVPFGTSSATITAAVAMIRLRCHLALTTATPSWIGPIVWPERNAPREILAMKTGNLHLPSMTTTPPTPALFTTAALSFDYDPNPPRPARWLWFLSELFGDDQEQIELLQEWFGYCLLADTRQQKALLVVGPRRSGKGTIARVLRELVGSRNCAGPTISSLSKNFGLQPLIGKTFAIVSDARFAGEGVPTVVERLLCITGEDAITIDRKFMDSVTLTLPTRFVFLTNELPRFQDSSNALTGRFMVLQLKTSFHGRENIELTNDLLKELPGILLWSVSGWLALHKRQHFVQPESVKESIQDLEDLASPVAAFVRDECTLAPDLVAGKGELFQAWTAWCKANGIEHVGTLAEFGRKLKSAFSSSIITGRRDSGGRFYRGLGVNPA